MYIYDRNRRVHGINDVYYASMPFMAPWVRDGDGRRGVEIPIRFRGEKTMKTGVFF